MGRQGNDLDRLPFCWTCGKESFPDEAAALADRERNGRRTLRAYRCPSERGWHLTSRQQPPRARRRR